LRDGIMANTAIGRSAFHLRNVAGFLHKTDKVTFGNTWRAVSQKTRMC
jgi:hypothetical protein